MILLLVSMGVLFSGGVAALVTHRHPRVSTGLAALAVVAGAITGLFPAARGLLGTSLPELRLAWAVPGGEIVLGLDPLSGFFLIPLLVLAVAAAVYGRAYMLAHAGMRNLGLPSLFFNVTVATMLLVILARQALLFLVSWELMSLASYLLVTFEHERPEVRRAGWIYLIASHLGLARLLRRRPRAADETWGCGYVAPTPRMQYTARSFSQLVSQNLLPSRLMARLQSKSPAGLLPEAARFTVDCTDPLTRGLYEPFFDRWARRFSRLRWLQQGSLHVYLLYILLVVVLALAWSSVLDSTWFWGGPWPRR